MTDTAVFHEEWFGTASQEALADLYGMVADLDGAVVEVGCWEGCSTIALANACYPAVVHAVDTWRGSDGEISAELAAQRDVFASFRRNVYSSTAGNVVPFRMDWRDYFPARALPIKFLHIDACHTFDEVNDNIEAALPFLVPGAVICGDDAHHPPVQQAVMAHFPNAMLKATLWWAQL